MQLYVFCLLALLVSGQSALAQVTLSPFSSGNVQRYSDGTVYNILSAYDAANNNSLLAYDANYHYWHPEYALGRAEGSGGGSSSQSDVRSPTINVGGVNGETKADTKTSMRGWATDDGAIDVTLRFTWSTPNPNGNGYVPGQNYALCTSDIGLNSMELYGVLFGAWTGYFAHGSDQPILLTSFAASGGYEFTRTSTALDEGDNVSWATTAVAKSKEHPALTSIFAKVELE